MAMIWKQIGMPNNRVGHIHPAEHCLEEGASVGCDSYTDSLLRVVTQVDVEQLGRPDSEVFVVDSIRLKFRNRRS